jgi:cardiolipin synthase
MSKTKWDSIQLYFSGDEYFRDVLSALSSAQKEVFIESYIFDMDPIGLRVLACLKDIATRGVKVHLTVDGVGSFNWLPGLRDYCEQNHIGFRIYHAMPIRLRYLKRISWKYLRRLLFFLRRANKRNHRKIILIDGRIAFLGSLNIAQVHTKEFMGKQAWRDTGIRVEGEALEPLLRTCQRVWSRSRFLGRTFFRLPARHHRLRQHPSQILRLNSNVRWRVGLLHDLNHRIRHAQKRILITNAYFLPRKSVLRNLRRAAEKGVFVGLCVPAHSDVTSVKWASRFLYLQMLKAGIHIFEYEPSMLHAKTLVIDHWATVGSHNLNHRSFLHDLEVEAVVSDGDSISQLIQQWDQDIKQSRAITLKHLGRMPWLHRLFARVAYWFRFWL